MNKPLTAYFARSGTAARETSKPAQAAYKSLGSTVLEGVTI